MSSLERQFGYGIAALTTAGVVTGAVTRIRGLRERSRRYRLHRRPDGSLVEFDLHLPRHAERVVLFESGLGMPHEYWDWICSGLPDEIGYLRYNRPGYGLSTPAPLTLRAHHALLDELRSTYLGSLPVTLAGHSLGGYLCAAYAAAHRGTDPRPARIVLVDSTHIGRLRASTGTETDLWQRHSLLLEQVWSAMGLAALNPTGNQRRSYREHVNRSHHAFMARRRTWVTAYREYRTSLTLPDVDGVGVPLDVVTASNPLSSGRPHLAAQAELLGLSRHSRHHVVEGADHLSLLQERAHAVRCAEVISRPPVAELAEQPLAERAEGVPR